MAPKNKKRQQKKKQVKTCEICGRSDRKDRLLGPLITVNQSITAHYHCVLFCPKTPGKEEYGEDGIGGMTARFIRSEGKRANPLVRAIFFIPFTFFFNLA